MYAYIAMEIPYTSNFAGVQIFSETKYNSECLKNE